MFKVEGWMIKNHYWLLVIAMVVIVSGCQPATSESTAAVTVVSMASSTPPGPTDAPTETAIAEALSDERQHLEGYFSFISRP